MRVVVGEANASSCIRFWDPKDNRCFNCSGIGHGKRECPHVEKPKIAKTQQGKSGGKGDSGNGKGQKGGDKPGKGSGNDKTEKTWVSLRPVTLTILRKGPLIKETPKETETRTQGKEELTGSWVLCLVKLQRL